MSDTRQASFKSRFKHHKQQDFCLNRPKYRQGRRLTAVKVYTVNNESQHLFFYGVPSYSLRAELKRLCQRFGTVTTIERASDAPCEPFTECYHVSFERLQAARVAKRVLDARSFYGGVLHVCYAPECESVEETKAKLMQRVKDVQNRVVKDQS